ncbi:glycosyltransferase family 4 protein [Methanoculleus frigidifontis]|nr:glycosyltransferase family 4 protein [Methanoculleus sp. FWC-SCC1]
MRVVYFTRPLEEAQPGVSKKMIAQIRSLQSLGVDAKIFSFRDRAGLEPGEVTPDQIFYSRPKTACDPGMTLGALLRRDICINQALRDLFALLGPTDVIYCRVPPLSISTIRSLQRPRSCRLVVEFQCIESRERWSSGEYLIALHDILFGRILRRKIDGIVGVTDEITAYQVKRAGSSSIPHVTIENGFAVDSVPQRDAPAMRDGELRILCVANVSRWHGLDRLIRGIAACSGMPGIALHIAGGGPEIPRLRSLAGDLGISERVVFHGFLAGEDLSALFDRCHVAVGSLGMHRKGLTQTAELKAREYCARGIPYIMACADPDFSADFPYILRVPPDESPIDIRSILAFAGEVCADADHPQKMRTYAREHLDWSVKMKKLKGFLETVTLGAAG